MIVLGAIAAPSLVNLDGGGAAPLRPLPARSELRWPLRGSTTLREVRTAIRRLPPAVLLIGAIIVALGCGGGGSDKDAQALLDKAFKQSIDSADLKLDAEVQVKGNPALSRPVRIEASGPFRTNEGKLPSADLELKLGGGGQTVETGFLSTGNRAFVKFQDVYYEQPAAEVRKANASIQRRKGNGRSLKSLGLDPRKWLGRARERGEENVAGVDTTHVSGTLDVKALLADLNRFVRRSGGAIGGATGQPAPDPLGKQDIDKIASVVRDPSFDVYVGKDDDTVRRIAGRLEVSVPRRDQPTVGGVQGGSLEFSLEFRHVNGEQKIEAPAKARPLSDLTRSLGTGALRGLGRGSGSGSAGPESSPPPSTAPPPGGGPDQKAFKEYSDCLEQAKPNDTAALQRCAQLLQPDPPVPGALAAGDWSPTRRPPAP